MLRFLLDGVHEEERRRRARRRKSAEDPEGAAAGGGPQSAVEAAAGAYICTAVECTACGTKVQGSEGALAPAPAFRPRRGLTQGTASPPQHRTFDPIFDASVPIVGSGDDVDPRRSRLRGKQKRWKRQQDGNVAAPGKPQRGANAGRHISKKERKRLAREARQKEKEEGAVAARSRQESRDKKKRAKAGVELEPSSPEDAYAKLNEAAAALERLEHAAGWAESAGKREVRGARPLRHRVPLHHTLPRPAAAQLVDFCQATASDAFLASRGLRGTVKAVAKTFRASVLQACAVELIRAHEMVWQAGGPSALRSGPAQGSGRRGDGKEQEAQAEGVDGSEANGEASEKGRVDEFTPADGARDGAPAPGPGCGAAAGELPSAEVCAGVAAGSGALAPGAASPSGTDVCSVAASGGGDGPTEQEGEEAGDSKPDDPFVDPAEPSRHVPAPGEEITLSMCLDEFVRSEMLRTSDGARGSDGSAGPGSGGEATAPGRGI